MDIEDSTAVQPLPPPLSHPGERRPDSPLWGAPTPMPAWTEPVEAAAIEGRERPGRKRKGLSTTGRLLLLVCGSGTVLAVGLSSLKANEQRSQPPVVDFPARAVGEAEPTIDHRNELGLDPSGVLVAETGQDAVVLSDARGVTWEIVLDAASGGPVASLKSPGAGAPPIRIDLAFAPVDLLPESIVAYVVESSSTPGIANERVTTTVDIAALRARDPATLEAWAHRVGLVSDDLGKDGAGFAVLEMLVDDEGMVRSFVLRVDGLDQVSYVRTSASQ